jgi:hypothetical protein
MSKFEVVHIGETDDIKKLDAFESQMKTFLGDLNYIQISDDETYEIACRFLDKVTGVVQLVQSITERFRKPAYDYYKSVLEEQKRILDPAQEAISVVRLRISEYVMACEVTAQIEKERAVKEQQQKLLTEAEQAFDEATAQNDVGAAEKALAILESPEMFIDAQGPSEAVIPDVKGISYRESWSAKLCNEDGTALKELCAAIGDRKAPVHLVQIDQTEVNKLARALRKEFSYPGLEVVHTKTLVRR